MVPNPKKYLFTGLQEDLIMEVKWIVNVEFEY